MTGSINITLIKVKLKPYGFHKMYMKKDLIEDKLYQITDPLNEKKVTPTNYIQYSLKKHIYFMMEIVERVRYCLLMTINKRNNETKI